MTPKELANVVMAIVEAHDVPAKERIEFLGLVASRLMVQPTTSAPPPQTLDAVPTAAVKVEAEGPVFITQGKECVCKACRKIIYRTNRDIPEKVTTEFFLKSFSPVNGAPVLEVGTSIFGDPHGNLAIDCPLCKGVKTVWIKGDGDYENLPDGS